MESQINSSGILLSVIIALVSDTTSRQYDPSHLAGCLEALEQQIDPPTLEIIVPYPAQALIFQTIKDQYLQVKFLPISDLKTYSFNGKGREHHDELRARGLAVARGDILALLEDHARPDPNWASQIVKAHQQGFTAIGGAIENNLEHPLNWAVYFCDFGKYQNPIPWAESSYASDANISYKRAALMSISTEWQDSFHETKVNEALLSRGDKLALSPDIIVYQHRKNLGLNSALKERFIWGQSYASTRSNLVGPSKRILYAIASPILPVILFARMLSNTIKKNRNLRAFLIASPLIILLLIGWSMGELSGYIKTRSA